MSIDVELGSFNVFPNSSGTNVLYNSVVQKCLVEVCLRITQGQLLTSLTLSTNLAV
jgi:hypothetical protein